MSSIGTRVGYRLNFIDFDSDSAYRFDSFDSNVINDDIKQLNTMTKSTGYIKTGLFKSCLCANRAA